MPADINLTPTASPFHLADKEIIGRSWGNASECWGAAILVHGLGANSGWFEALGRRLKVRGMYAVAYDQIGFGKNKNQPLHHYQEWLDTLQDIYGAVAQQVKDKPVFILGNSMGALITAAQANTIQSSGLVWFSPGFEGNWNCFTLTFRLRALLQALLVPQSKLPLPYPTKLITRNPHVCSWIENDPDYQREIPAKMFLELLKLTRKISKRYSEIKLPVLMLTAGQDHIVDNQVNQRIFHNLGGQKKQQHCFPEAWHDLMFDPDLDQVVDQVVQWMSLCLPERISHTGNHG